jgi:hypothetical protein
VEKNSKLQIFAMQHCTISLCYHVNNTKTVVTNDLCKLDMLLCLSQREQPKESFSQKRSNPMLSSKLTASANKAPEEKFHT